MKPSLLVAVATLVALGGAARAERIARPCACPQEIDLPSPGAPTLPKNAKRWHIARFGGVHTPTVVPTPNVLGVQRFEPAPGTSDEAWRGVALTDADNAPPAAPGDARVSISLVDESGAYRRLAALAVRGRYDADTALLRIDIHDPDGVVSLITTPQAWWLCDPGAILVGKDFTAEVRTIDLAGNESAPVVARVATSLVSPRVADMCTSEHRDAQDSYGPCVPFFLGPVVIYTRPRRVALRPRSP